LNFEEHDHNHGHGHHHAAEETVTVSVAGIFEHDDHSHRSAHHHEEEEEEVGHHGHSHGHTAGAAHCDHHDDDGHAHDHHLDEMESGMALVPKPNSHPHHGHDAADSHEVHSSGKKAKFHRDNNYRAAICHVVADAFVSVLVIIALAIGHVTDTTFLDPAVAIIGVLVILSWAFTLIQDTTANLLDLNPDEEMTNALREHLQKDGSSIIDLHVWRLGPGHLGAIIAVETFVERKKEYYLKRIKGFKALSHVTIEINQINH
jgi:cation diffusion facilitator family transporter